MITQYKEANLVLWVIYSLSHTAEDHGNPTLLTPSLALKTKKGSFIYFYGTQLKEDVTIAALV